MDGVFLDANVLFSAAYGSPGLRRLWQEAKEGRCRLLASNYVIEEADRNLEDAEQRSRLQALLDDLQIVAEGPPDTPCPLALADKDRPVWNAAAASRATHLLTGDVRHFGAHFGKTVQGVRIQRPAAYLASRSGPPSGRRTSPRPCPSRSCRAPARASSCG